MEEFTKQSICSPKEFSQLLQERDKKIIRDAQEAAKRVAEIETSLFNFEIFYSAVISEKTKKDNAKWFANHREMEWKKALEKAEGDELKALSIYGGD